MLKRFLFNSVTISLPKNIVQFFLGVILYWFLVGTPDTYTTLISMSGFVLAYSSVYLFNDIFDYKEDMKDDEKLKWKPIASGHLSIGRAKMIAVVLVLLGLSVSMFVNLWFFIFVIAMIFFNMLHSSPLTRFKKDLYKTTANMTIIEFLKYSCGWFALTSNISRFPFWLIMAFSVVYVTSYIIYKFNFRGKIIREKRKLFWGMGIFGILAYIISLVHYGFPLTLIFLVLIPLVVLVIFRYMNVEVHRISNMIFIEYLLLPFIIICFVILTIPSVGHANESLAEGITNISGSVTDTISENVPYAVMKPIENISDRMKEYETLDDLAEKINRTFSGVTDPLVLIRRA